jgi:hypothetical protein
LVKESFLDTIEEISLVSRSLRESEKSWEPGILLPEQALVESAFLPVTCGRGKLAERGDRKAFVLLSGKSDSVQTVTGETKAMLVGDDDACGNERLQGLVHATLSCLVAEDDLGPFNRTRHELATVLVDAAKK